MLKFSIIVAVSIVIAAILYFFWLPEEESSGMEFIKSYQGSRKRVRKNNKETDVSEEQEITFITVLRDRSNGYEARKKALEDQEVSYKIHNLKIDLRAAAENGRTQVSLMLGNCQEDGRDKFDYLRRSILYDKELAGMQIEFVLNGQDVFVGIFNWEDKKCQCRG